MWPLALKKMILQFIGCSHGSLLMHNAPCFNSSHCVPPKTDLFLHHFEVYLAQWVILNNNEGLLMFWKVHTCSFRYSCTCGNKIPNFQATGALHSYNICMIKHVYIYIYIYKEGVFPKNNFTFHICIKNKRHLGPLLTKCACLSIWRFSTDVHERWVVKL